MRQTANTDMFKRLKAELDEVIGQWDAELADAERLNDGLNNIPQETEDAIYARHGERYNELMHELVFTPATTAVALGVKAHAIKQLYDTGHTGVLEDGDSNAKYLAIINDACQLAQP